MNAERSKNWFIYDTNWTIPQTTTQESLEQGTKLHTKFRIIDKKQLNFQSYPMNTRSGEKKKSDTREIPQLRTSYARDFVAPETLICKPTHPQFCNPDPLFNRRPMNCFAMLPWANTKFMDDHLTNVSEERKKLNFFRQLRNHSSIF